MIKTFGLAAFCPILLREDEVNIELLIILASVQKQWDTSPMEQVQRASVC